MRLRLAAAVSAALLACLRCCAALRVADVAVREAGGAMAVAARLEGAPPASVSARYTLNFDTTARDAAMTRGRCAPVAPLLREETRASRD